LVAFHTHGYVLPSVGRAAAAKLDALLGTTAVAKL
jgi:hypothetical protein